MEDKLNILVIEPRPLVGKTLTQHLPASDYRIKTISNKLISKQLVQEDFDLVFLDSHQRDPKSERLVEKIKKNIPHTLIILITDNTFADDLTGHHQRSVFDLLTKPVSPEALFNAFYNAIYSIKFQKEKNQIEKEKYQLENQLHQSQKMEAIGTLAGGIAHDFNNILSAIIGYTELTIQDIPANNRIHNNLKRILNAGERARDLIRQILTFSRQDEKEFNPVLVQPIVKEALKLLRASLPTTIKIQTEIESDATVLADPTQIHQILINLCTNAYHAMQDHGGFLKISLADTHLTHEFCANYPDLKPGMHLRLQVSDTGVGIPSDIIKRIFDPFFTTKERGKGTGMGLAVVHGIVKSHGGTITVKSQPGQGALFEIFIPVVSVNSTPVPRDILGPMPTGSERILFIDDEVIQKDLVQQMLERLGYQVTARNCGREALSLFCNNPDQFDLVITDMTMPAMTGDVLAQKMMRLRPDIPIILCTGYSDKINKEKALSMGARGFMMKPLSMKEMATLIRNVLSPV